MKSIMFYILYRFSSSTLIITVGLSYVGTSLVFLQESQVVHAQDICRKPPRPQRPQAAAWDSHGFATCQLNQITQQEPFPTLGQFPNIVHNTQTIHVWHMCGLVSGVNVP